MDKISVSQVIPHPPQVNEVKEQVPYKAEQVKTSGAQVNDFQQKNYLLIMLIIRCGLPFLTFLSIFHHLR